MVRGSLLTRPSRATGWSSTSTGSAAALDIGDVVLAQYREVGVLLHRGFTMTQVMNQCFSNEYDLGKGRQMPIHYGSREVSRPLPPRIFFY